MASAVSDSIQLQGFNENIFDEDPLRDYSDDEIYGGSEAGNVRYAPNAVLKLSDIAQAPASDTSVPPEQCYIDSFLERSPYVPNGEGQIVSGKFSFNWLSPNDYAANWKHLDENTREIFYRLINGDSSGSNYCYYGLKEHDSLPEHLLVLLGADIQNILPGKKTDMVTANLRTKGLHARYRVGCRALCPRSAQDAMKKSDKTYDPAAMFKDFDAATLLIDSPASLHHIQEFSGEHRAAYMGYFHENLEFFKQQARKHRIFSYYYSHEVSVTSILRRNFCPHTHVVVFYPKGTELQLGDMQDDLAKKHPDRTLSMDTSYVKGGIHRSYRTVKDFFPYIQKVSTLARTYKREFSYEVARDINVGTIHCLRTLIELSAGTGDEKCLFLRTNGVQMAKKTKKNGKNGTFVHPELKRLKRKAADKQKKLEKKAAKKLEKAEKKAAACSRRKNKVTKARKCVKRDVVAPASEELTIAAIPEPRLSKPVSGDRKGRKVVNRRTHYRPDSDSSRRTMNTINIFRKSRPAFMKAAQRSCAWSRAGPMRTHNNQRHSWMNR